MVTKDCIHNKGHSNRQVYDPKKDRNFDGLAQRFAQNIYGSLKGEIRQAVIHRDLQSWVFACNHKAPLKILDAGGGQGQMSIAMARLGHKVVLVDLSEEMLALAEKAIVDEGLQNLIDIEHGAIQDLVAGGQSEFDVILCHAVLEWLGQPWETLDGLMTLLKPAGYFSLAFYNLHALVFKNLLRGNFDKVGKQDYRGFRGSLTPNQAIDPDKVWLWQNKNHLLLQGYSGIRVFQDYWLQEPHFQHSDDIVIEQELAFSRRDPYRQMGRYIHAVFKAS